MKDRILFVDPRFVARNQRPAVKNPSPRQLEVRWANRAQRATVLQTEGVWHAKVTSRGIRQQMN